MDQPSVTTPSPITTPSDHIAPTMQDVMNADKSLDPNIHTYQFLNDNNYEIRLESLDEKNPFLDGRGFVLTDKPLLVVRVVKKEASK